MKFKNVSGAISEPSRLLISFLKFRELLTMKIREIAKQHNIPLHEDKELARALFKLCDVGDFIPTALFKAVAQVLAYIYQLKNEKKKKKSIV